LPAAGVCPGIANNRVDHAIVRTAPAYKVAADALFDIGAAGAGVVANERIAVQDRAADAVGALPGLFCDECLLDGVQSVRVGQAVQRGETLKGSDAVPVGAGDVRDAGADGLSVQQHGACPALRESTAESRAVELEIFLQYEQQGSRWIVNGDGRSLTIDLKGKRSHKRYWSSWWRQKYMWQVIRCQLGGRIFDRILGKKKVSRRDVRGRVDTVATGEVGNRHSSYKGVSLQPDIVRQHA